MLSRKSVAGFVAAILATTCLGFAARGSHKSAGRTVEVNFNSNTNLNNGKSLPAGTYRMEVPKGSQTPTVTFSQGGKVVATTEAKVGAQQKKNQSTEVDSDTQGDAQVLTAIHPAGWDEELVFAPSGQ